MGLVLCDDEVELVCGPSCCKVAKSAWPQTDSQTADPGRVAGILAETAASCSERSGGCNSEDCCWKCRTRTSLSPHWERFVPKSYRHFSGRASAQCLNEYGKSRAKRAPLNKESNLHNRQYLADSS